MSTDPADLPAVPDDVVPHGRLPALRYRDLPEPVHWVKMVGPSLILAGMALGSGEFIIWPHIVYKAGFVFFWACLLGVLTQFFLNMEIERWTLATGESAVTGFARLSRWWAPVMLLMAIVPWAWPGWATGAGQIISWLIVGPVETVREGAIDVAHTSAAGLTGAAAHADATGEIMQYRAKYVSAFGIAGLVLVGLILTAGPVVYNTVERIQAVLVGFILAVVIVLAIVVVRPDAVQAMAVGSVNLGGMPDLDATGITMMGLLGALAFAGAGGSLNLGQSNYIKDKGYGMGRYIGRITSPVTGEPEAAPDVGYLFPQTPENVSRWRGWWRSANIEHAFSFLLTCVVCLCLMTLIAYSLFRDESGALKPGMERFGSGMDFVWGQATVLGRSSVEWGALLKFAFLLVGIAVLLTTELGVLDVTARVSTDIVKVNWLRDSQFWTQSRLYFCFLWGEILLGTIILLIPGLDQPLFLLKTSAAMNGGVMFLYSLILLYMNGKLLRGTLAMSPLRFTALVWSSAFFGYFTIQALRMVVLPWLFGG